MIDRIISKSNSSFDTEVDFKEMNQVYPQWEDKSLRD